MERIVELRSALSLPTSTSPKLRVAGLIDAAQWRAICALMEQRLRGGDAEAAAVTGVTTISALLAEHFPRTDFDGRHNELPDLPQILG